MLTSVKNNNTMEKQAKNNEHVFYRGRKPNNKHSKMLYSFVIKKMLIKTPMRPNFRPTRLASIKNPDTIRCSRR